MALGARGQQLRPAEERKDTNRSAQSSLGSRKGTQALAKLETRVGLRVDPAAQRPGMNKQTQGLLGSYSGWRSQRRHRQGTPPEQNSHQR